MAVSKTIEVCVAGTERDHGRKAGDEFRQEQRYNRQTIFQVLRVLEVRYPFIAIVLEAISGFKVKSIGLSQSTWTYSLGLDLRVRIWGNAEGTCIDISADEDSIDIGVEEAYSEDVSVSIPLAADEDGQVTPMVKYKAMKSIQSVLKRWGMRT